MTEKCPSPTATWPSLPLAWVLSSLLLLTTAAQVLAQGGTPPQGARPTGPHDFGQKTVLPDYSTPPWDSHVVGTHTTFKPTDDMATFARFSTIAESYQHGTAPQRYPSGSLGATPPTPVANPPQEQSQPKAVGRKIQVEVYDLRDDAVTQANLHNALREEIQKLAKELAEVSLTTQQAERELLWLRKHPSVEETSSRQEIQDPLTGQLRITRRIAVNLPPEVLEQWVRRLEALHFRHIWGYIYGSLGTIVLFLVIYLVARRVDYWTNGYHKWKIAFFGALLFVGLTAALWTLMYAAYLW
ncbi:MAG: hypothetical protein RMI91_08465 [Gemmatales bacterium]|nr:hypothetical protein [Gemmatales bacterium]MDW7994673.1 hypothetical protein [Gemmatales bacterium]